MREQYVYMCVRWRRVRLCRPLHTRKLLCPIFTVDVGDFNRILVVPLFGVLWASVFDDFTRNELLLKPESKGCTHR